MSLFCKMILLSDLRDIAFAKIAQGARVDGATLPSGLKVPVTPGHMWIVRGEYIRCISDNINQSNVQTRLPE